VSHLSDLADQLLNAHLIPGSVWYALETFGDESKALKFLVIVKEVDSKIFYLRPTSNGSYFKKNSHCSYLEFPAGTYNFFNVETFISCDQLASRPKSDFVQLAKKNQINYKGQLSLEHCEEIMSKLKTSRVLARREKSYLFGE
jgi:hypothetical protein